MKGLDTDESSTIIDVCTAEIRAHLLIYVCVFVPLLGVIYPFIFTFAAVYVVLPQFSRLAAYFSLKPLDAATHWPVLIIICGITILFAAALKARSAFVSVAAMEQPFRELTRIPCGPKGVLLIQSLNSIWERLPTANRPRPEIVWYSNFGVLAHAYDDLTGQHIEVSSGLWERITRNDLVATTILAHETAHLVFRDPLAFRALAVTSATIRHLLRLTLGIGLGAVAVTLVFQVADDIADSLSLLEMFIHVLAIFVVSVLVLASLPMSAMIIRRYSGFIVSLFEIRADVSAALWTTGLDRFVIALANDPTLHRSSLKDFGRSLVSLDLTHIPETERVNLLSSTDRLITPKLRYFGLSVVLPFILPVSAATYLIFGGAIDHLLVTAITAIFQVTAVSMLQIGSKAARISWKRAFSLAAAVCFIQALPRINLAPVGYLLTHFAVSIAVPGGFGSNQVSFDQAIDDIHITALDVAHKALEATDSWRIVYSLLLTYLSIMIASSLARSCSTQANNYRGVVPSIIVTGLMSVLCSYDPWRNMFFSVWPLTISSSLLTATDRARWVLLCAPFVSGLLAMALQLGWMRCRVPYCSAAGDRP